MITFTIRHRFHVGLFPYWIGFSNRTWGGNNRVIDIGYIKIMWAKRLSAALNGKSTKEK